MRSLLENFPNETRESVRNTFSLLKDKEMRGPQPTLALDQISGSNPPVSSGGGGRAASLYAGICRDDSTAPKNRKGTGGQIRRDSSMVGATLLYWALSCFGLREDARFATSFAIAITRSRSCSGIFAR